MGRPATGQTPVRTIRLGHVWDESKRLAKASGMTFADYVAQALQRQNARVERSLKAEKGLS